MFEIAGELEYRQLRQAAVRDLLRIYDDFYEQARKMLSEREPLIMRPVRKGRNLFIVDTEDLSPSTTLGGNGEDPEGAPV
jgi:hypothetical protein